MYVYESMYPSVGTYTKKEVASILCTKEKSIKLKIMDVQMLVVVTAAYLLLLLQQP